MTRSKSNLALFSLALALAACSHGQAETGSVSLAITATGSDGATYALPTGTRLTLAANPGTANYDAGLDGASMVVVVPNLAAGTYNASLYNTDNNYTTSWPLTRTATDGSTSTVMSKLTTAVPAPVTVTIGQQAQLSFQFEIATGGKVTFGHGTVAVKVGVGQTQATSYTAAMSGSGNMAAAPTITGTYAPQLTMAMPTATTTGLQVSVAVTLTGPWQEEGGTIDATGSLYTVCAPITVSAQSASGNQGFADALAETGHGMSPSFLFGPASLCINDDGTTTGQTVRLRLSREGAAETATFKTIFGTTPVLFWNVLIGTLPAKVYDASTGTLDLDALSGTQTLPFRYLERIGSDISNLWYVGTTTGMVSFTFTPLP